MQTNPFNRRTSYYCEVGHANARESGGLKGKMAPGDAHPYLALFYLKLFLSFDTDARGRKLFFMVNKMLYKVERLFGNTA